MAPVPTTPARSRDCGSGGLPHAHSRHISEDLDMRLARGLMVPLGLILALAGNAARAADQCGDADLSKLAGRIYVAPSGSDSPSCGASASGPCQSVQQGINRCAGANCGVLVRYGLYALADTVQLRDGVSVYGRCVFDGDTDRKYRSVLQAPAGGKPAINSAKINTPTLLDGFFVWGSDATTPGGASIAMTVIDSSQLTLRWTQLASGKGADGAPGTTSTSAGQGATGGPSVGDSGGEGGNACGGGTLQGKGGKGADIQQVSSWGCFVTCKCQNNNYPNSVGRAGQDSGAVKGGGGGGRGRAGCACDERGGDNPEDGPSGVPGNAGACGSQGGTVDGNAWGRFNGVNWTPTRGGHGGSGAVGSGGGGGGSGGYAAFLSGDFSVYDAHGRPGGGGGGGGCGGDGGTGGQQGGASVPIVVVNSSVNMAGDHYRNLFIPGPGGRGGNAGRGGMGGPGGPGVPGGRGHFTRYTVRLVCDGSVPGNGGEGGPGGQGGAGSGGAGGNGGPSIGIALVGQSPAPDNNQGIYEGQPGAGGNKGSGGQNSPSPGDPMPCTGADGAPGVAGGKSAWQKY